MNTTTPTTRRFSLYTIVSIIVNLFTVGAAGISFSHIITASAQLGVVNWQAYTVPFFVDGLAILGMIGRSASMAAQLAARGRTEDQIDAVRRFGFRLQVSAGLVSLAANIYAGHNLGEKMFGVLVVAGFVICEKFAEKLRAAGSAAVDTAAEITAADVQAAVSAAVDAALAAAAAAHADATAVAVAAAVKKEQARVRRAANAAAKKAEADAPSSAIPMVSGLVVPTVAEMAALIA